MESLVGKKRVKQIRVPVEQLSVCVQFSNIRLRYKMVTFQRRNFEEMQKATCGLNVDFGSAFFLTRSKKACVKKLRELELLTVISSNLVSGVFEINVHEAIRQLSKNVEVWLTLHHQSK